MVTMQSPISDRSMEYERFRLLLTQTAKDDLDSIVNYMAVDLASPKAAASFIDKVLSTADNICIFPESGSRVDNDFLKNANIRFKVIGNYTLYYLPDFTNKTCTILRVVYGGRNLNGIINNLNQL